jgi:hypothetical protein
MPQFQLDTEGGVGRWDGAQLHFYDDIDAFTRGYIEALFFTDGDDLCAEWTPPEGSGEMDASIGFSDLAPETLQRIIEDCRDFQKINIDALCAAYLLAYEEDQAGRDFWFTRNGHGVGFWDRDELAVGDLDRTLTDASKAFREMSAYLGDDGKVYLA